MEQQLPLSVPPDRRSIPRFDVGFRTLVSNQSGLNNQLGIILDLSLSGCQVRVPNPGVSWAGDGTTDFNPRFASANLR